MARMIPIRRSKEEGADLGVWDFVPARSRSVKARLARKRFDRVAFKPKSVYFPAKAWNQFLKAKKRVEKEDPRRRLYPYEFATDLARRGK